MTELKIKDNQYRSKSDFEIIKSLTEKIANKTLEQLEKEGVFLFPRAIKDSEDISKEQKILESVNDSYKSSNIVGFLGYGKERLIIESRFSTEENDYFFQYLLECVLGFPNILNFNTSAKQNNLMFNLLIYIFPQFLKEAMRKGLFKTYVRNQYNDGNIKGIIDINRHVKMNTPFIGNIAYNQREFSYDNYLMQLVRHTIEFIKRKSYGNSLLQKVKDEVEIVVGVTSNYEFLDKRRIINSNIKNPIRHAYYREYRALQRLCIMILKNEKHQFVMDIQQVHGILFDGAWVWEEYVNLLIGNYFYHPLNKIGKWGQRFFDGNIGLIFPDFISKRVDNRIIADAKYKPNDNIRGTDYQQLLSYMFRFDAKEGLFLYPQNNNDNDYSVLKMNSGSTYENNVSPRDNIKVIKCGLKIPKDCLDYVDFKEKIKQSEADFLKKISLIN